MLHASGPLSSPARRPSSEDRCLSRFLGRVSRDCARSRRQASMTKNVAKRTTEVDKGLSWTERVGVPVSVSPKSRERRTRRSAGSPEPYPQTRRAETRASASHTSTRTVADGAPKRRKRPEAGSRPSPPPRFNRPQCPLLCSSPLFVKRTLDRRAYVIADLDCEQFLRTAGETRHFLSPTPAPDGKAQTRTGCACATAARRARSGSCMSCAANLSGRRPLRS